MHLSLGSHARSNRSWREVCVLLIATVCAANASRAGQAGWRSVGRDSRLERVGKVRIIKSIAGRALPRPLPIPAGAAVTHMSVGHPTGSPEWTVFSVEFSVALDRDTVRFYEGVFWECRDVRTRVVPGSAPRPSGESGRVPRGPHAVSSTFGLSDGMWVVVNVRSLERLEGPEGGPTKTLALVALGVRQDARAK